MKQKLIWAAADTGAGGVSQKLIWAGGDCQYKGYKDGYFSEAGGDYYQKFGGYGAGGDYSKYYCPGAYQYNYRGYWGVKLK